jgi:N-dimethylarginine dimethylaminohydrolase
MKILVCDPSFYQIDYEINPWMSVSHKADTNLAIQQWNTLINELLGLGVDVVRIPPQSGLPDMVFTANGGVMAYNYVILSNFKHKERQDEKEFFKKWFNENGIRVIEISNGIRFEGAGDCLVKDHTVFMGYGFRTDQEAYYDNIWDVLDMRSFRLRLFDPYFYHLDTCFCPLNKNQILIYPEAFDKNDLVNLRRNNFELLCVPKEDAHKFACNAVLVGDHILIPKGCDETRDILTQNYYIVHELDMSEFIKAGGACKCLTMVVG